MSKKLFKNKKVLIMGLGLHGGGVGVAKFFCEQGANVLVTDLKTKEHLRIYRKTEKIENKIFFRRAQRSRFYIMPI